MAVAGYSGTPLSRKLGIKAGFRLSVIHPPAHYESILQPLPEEVSIIHELSGIADLVHVFCRSEEDLHQVLSEVRNHMPEKGIVWISWTKKSSPQYNGIDGNYVREAGLASGLVDIKVAAIDADWSGLKFVIPVKDRK